MTRKCFSPGSRRAHAAAVSSGPSPELESRLPVSRRPEALDEVLVGVGRVELHEFHPLLRLAEETSELASDERLSRARRPLKDDLTLLLQQRLDLFQERRRDEELFRELRQASRRGRVAAIALEHPSE